MKRVIVASRYSDSADKNLKWLGMYGEALGKVAKARSDEEWRDALSGLGLWTNHVKSKHDAVKGLIDNIEFMASEYLAEANSASMLPVVEDDVTSYLKQLGYPMTTTAPSDGHEVAYLILPSAECDIDDLRRVASAIAKNFNVKPDTGAIGGSWTSYEFDIHGVKFRVELDRDGALVLQF